MSSFQVSARVDSKGRLLLPRRVRDTRALEILLYGPSVCWGHGVSIFRKVAEHRAVNDAVMEEAGRYHWKEEPA
jgi:hypothetical protein